MIKTDFSFCYNLQVVIFAVYAYFAFALIGEQELNHDDGKFNISFLFSLKYFKSGKLYFFPFFFYLFHIWNQASSSTPSSRSSSSSSSSSSTAGWGSPLPLTTLGRESIRRTSRWWKKSKKIRYSKINYWCFWQIKELVQRHFWSIGRSLQQEKSQLLWPTIKAQPNKEAWFFIQSCCNICNSMPWPTIKAKPNKAA